MKTVRNSLVLCSVAAALSFSAQAFAEDTHGKQGSHTGDHSSSGTKSTTTTATPGSTGTAPQPMPMGSGASGAGAGGVDATQPGMSSVPNTAWGASGTMNTDSSTYPMTEPTQSDAPAQPVTPPPATSTYAQSSTTTTTSGSYDPSLYADKSSSYKVRPNRPLLITGSSIFLGSYAATAIQGAASDKQADEDNNYIPLAGPWMNLADRPCGLGDCGRGEDVNQALLIGSGVAQAAGVAIALSSLFIPEERESNSAKVRSTTTTAKSMKPNVTVMPIAMGRNGSGGGFGAVGRF